MVGDRAVSRAGGVARAGFAAPVSVVLAVLLAVVLAVGTAGCAGSDPGSGSGSAGPSTVALAGRLKAVVVARHHHDDTAFTEGLVFTSRNRLWESTGIVGQSDVRLVDPTSGKVVRRAALDAPWFGEGLAEADGQLVQLTWRNGVVLRWSIPALRRGEGATISGEGWGLATLPDGSLIASDGTATLSVRDPGDLTVTRTIAVTDRGAPLAKLNELEVVDGQVWANVWTTSTLVRIDPGTGRVTARVDLSALDPVGLDDPDAVLNGIAHRPGDPANRLWVTGKRWPTMFEIRLEPA